MASKGSAPVELTAEGKQFLELFGKTSQVDRKLRTALRKRMKQAAEKGAAEVRSTVESAPVKGRRSRGLRRGIAAGVGVALTTTTAANRVGVKIVARQSGLPQDMRPLVKAFNKPKFRHPVFASFGGSGLAKVGARRTGALAGVGKGARNLDRALKAHKRGSAKWVEQDGHPYFEKSVEKHLEGVQAAVLAAMEEATASLKQGTSDSGGALTRGGKSG